ncbi:coatomer beta' subunit [Punctularia strigosozonata HHB-11173 SS5]|uniref:coatomer beta' subunit n=1 Tax=Punctularia strigosozonata (strain HHB-11173) TaxID=741275 RepID=UPI0004416C52|nr:coatomer beta' subunit [Punctularia strigosozonata HHB-11173 SS5]EIN11093.1 coatomer beta' subunit [Punctularia strigosozonata HHB-11173 SS5]
MLLDVKRKLFSRSDRVKGVDFHPTEPWLLTGLYNGTVNIYNRETGALLKTFEVSEVPVRCVRFIARKNWFVAGSDDFQLRVFNYNTHEKVHAFEAHPDYIRCLTVHPTASIVLTGSDDMTIKAWDWEKNWKCVQVYEGHTHYIMNIAVNPKDGNTFASSCLDRTVKMWSLGSPHANFTMEAHEKGTNFVEFYPGADKPYLVTTGDDKTIKIWDYLSKSCVQTMASHTHNVSFAVFHPNLPIIVSGSEDGTVKIWNSGTYRLENTLSYGLERAWCVALRKDANEVAVGFDEGVVVIKLGRDEPTYSMDPSGKLIYTRNQEVLLANLATLSEDAAPEGSRVPISAKELGSTELFAAQILHSPNGRFVAVVGDGEYIVYTALAWRNKSFGTGSGFAWAGDSNTYAVLEGKTKIRMYKNFKERAGAGMKGAGSWSIEGIYGGPLLAARGPGFVMFWDWESGEVVRRIDVDARGVYWSTSGTLVTITTEDGFFVLRFDREAYDNAVSGGADVGDEGVEEAFDVVAEISESVKTAKWIGDCFIYTTGGNRLNYVVGTESDSITQFDAPMYLLGYIPAHNRVYVADKNMNVYGFMLSLSLVEYQTAVLRGDMDAAAEILPQIPKEQRNRVARFLESRGHKQLALEVTTDPDHKFDLSLQLDDLDSAIAITRTVPEQEAELKWKQLGDRALTIWRFDLAKECFEKANDLGALMLLYLSIGDRAGLTKLAKKAEEKGENNLAFATLFQLGDAKACTELLIKTGRQPEAALFARTYAPSQAAAATDAWKSELKSKNRSKIAASIASPAENEDIFEEGWADALSREEAIHAKTNGTSDVISEAAASSGEEA